MTIAKAPLTPLNRAKFRDPDVTAGGQPRASVALSRLRTLWFNTGTLCNLTCVNCYIESSPRNDRLAYLNADEVRGFLDEAAAGGWPAEEIGFTGGEPFMNAAIIEMMGDALGRGLRVLVLTNAMRPMMKLAAPLLDLRARFAERLTVRVSLDHYGRDLHETERGVNAWEPALEGLKWLSDNRFHTHVAGRTLWGEPEVTLRRGYGRLFAARGIAIDADDPVALVLFPEMDEALDVPEITTACWGLLNVNPDAMMCASSRMVVKHKGAARPTVVPCTLLPYDPRFHMGESLNEAGGAVMLNHPHCAKFCVLGGGACSA
jgi:hypothetical protein